MPIRLTRAVLALAFSLFITSTGFAEMRFYVVPKIGVGTLPDPYRPKYIPDMGVPWSGMNYGKGDTMLVGADVSPAQHTVLASETDVISIPANLDAKVGASALATVQNAIEGMKVPANWVTTANTYREVVSTVGKIFLLMQRFDGLRAKTFFDAGITLGTRINELSANQRQDLQAAASSLGLDVSFVTGTMTVRQVLRTWALAMPSFTLGGQTF